jgi:hypothetical protein
MFLLKVGNLTTLNVAQYPEDYNKNSLLEYLSYVSQKSGLYDNRFDSRQRHFQYQVYSSRPHI